MYTSNKCTVYFNLRHNIPFGKRLWLTGNIRELGNWDRTKAIGLDVSKETCWRITVSVDASPLVFDNTVEYHYFIADYHYPCSNVTEDQQYMTRDFKLRPLIKRTWIKIDDRWDQPYSVDRVRIFNPRMIVALNVEFQCHVEYGKAIYVMGNVKELGNDDYRRAKRMEWTSWDNWKLVVEIDAEQSEEEVMLTFMQASYDRCVQNQVKGKRKIEMKSMIYKRLVEIWQEKKPDTPLVCEILERDCEGSGKEMERAKVEGNMKDISCVVCQERDRNVMFMDCNHFCCCGICVRSLRSKRCPTCRAEIVKVVNVYVS